MHDLIRNWRNTRMIVLTAVCAAAYVAVLVPFKGFVLIPGLTEVRPGAAIPVVLSFLFGPAAAWGAAFGNLIADVLGGMLTPVSVFGFAGNLVYGYLPYALWRAFMGQAHPVRSGLSGWVAYALILVASCLAVGSIIGWGADLIRMAPFAALGLIIAVNDLIATAIISTLLLALLYDRVRNWGLLYFQILDAEVSGTPAGSLAAVLTGAPAALLPAGTGRRWARAGAVLCLVGAVVAFLSGLLLSGQSLHAGYGEAAFASGVAGSLTVGAGMTPGLCLLLVGILLL